MRVSWVILTHNRRHTVERAFQHNYIRAGRQIDELVWVDNGSTDGVDEYAALHKPDVFIKHLDNLGVAKGYNRGMAVASGTHIVITGCDMLMPENWLHTFARYVQEIPETGVACMYSKPLAECRERSRSEKGSWCPMMRLNSVLWYMAAMPLERRIFSKDFLEKTGYLREDFGLYGWEDVEWAYRAERVCRENKLLSYVIPDQVPTHLGTEGINPFDGKDEKEYHAFKQREANDMRKRALLQECAKKNFPYYNPFAGGERAD